MSSGYRFKRADALRAAEALVEQIGDQCLQLKIAGSLRRGKHSVGDIELVAQPVVEKREIAPVAAQLSLFGGATGGASAKIETISHLDQQLNALVSQGVIYKDRPYTHEKGVWGDKRKQFWIDTLVSEAGAVLDHLPVMTYIKVDLYIVTPPAQWGPIFAIRTGDSDFTGHAGLMRWINERTPYQQTQGRLIVAATGDEIETPTEKDYFRALGLPYIEPRKRDLAKIQQMFRMMRPPRRSASARDKTEVTSKAGAPPAGEQANKPVLSIRIRAVLKNAGSLHPDALIERLGCDRDSFDLAVRTLKSLGNLVEDEHGHLRLVEQPAPEVNDQLEMISSSSESEQKLPGREPDGEFDETIEKVVFVRGPEILWPKGTIHGVDDPPACYGARLRIVPKTAIKALTLHQPWASFIAYGLKQFETRNWATNYRGLIAIHAGKTQSAEVEDFDLYPRDMIFRLPYPLPLGAVVAVAQLVDCVPTDKLLDDDAISDNEYELGNFARGRYGWKLEIIKRFDEPIPARGQQGLWDWDGWDGVIAEQPAPESQERLENISSHDELEQRILDRLADIVLPLHRTAVWDSIGCVRDEFNTALDRLKARGAVIEDAFYHIHRPDVPFKRTARPPKMPDKLCEPQLVSGYNEIEVRRMIRKRLEERAGIAP